MAREGPRPRRTGGSSGGAVNSNEGVWDRGGGDRGGDPTRCSGIRGAAPPDPRCGGRWLRKAAPRSNMPATGVSHLRRRRGERRASAAMAGAQRRGEDDDDGDGGGSPAVGARAALAVVEKAPLPPPPPGIG